MREFRGLSGSQKAKAVCDQVGAKKLAELDDQPFLQRQLFKAMNEATTPPSPNVLGIIGKDVIKHCLAQWHGTVDPDRYWYRCAKGLNEDNLPYVFECSIAEVEQSSHRYHCLNFSIAFDDPLHGTHLFKNDDIEGYGINGLLNSAKVFDHSNVVVFTHLTAPGLNFLDRGKSRLEIPDDMTDAITDALYGVSRVLYSEYKKRKADAARAERAAQQRLRQATMDKPPSSMSLLDACYEVMERAYNLATGNEQYEASQRTLFYQVQRLIQELTDKELDGNYFGQNILPRYRREVKPLPKVYYDPRGFIYEPHTQKQTPIGTREADSYEFPHWCYDKILYIEKKGFWPVLKDAYLAERHDMAIVCAEGYSTTAIRSLFAKAQTELNYKIFVCHDCDPDGYNIARTLRESTIRMPDHQIEIIDLGLTLNQALTMDLQSETFTCRKALPQDLELTEAEEAMFTGRSGGRKAYIAERIELNAMTSPQLVVFIEKGLQDNGGTDKVIPDDGVLKAEADRQY